MGLFKKIKEQTGWGELLKSFAKEGEPVAEDNYKRFNDGTIDISILDKAWGNVDDSEEAFVVVEKEKAGKEEKAERKYNNYERNIAVSRGGKTKPSARVKGQEEVGNDINERGA